MTPPRVVVIGAGVVGSALADELTARGWTDVTVLEQGPLLAPGGSTSHAPGLVFQTNRRRRWRPRPVHRREVLGSRRVRPGRRPGGRHHPGAAGGPAPPPRAARRPGAIDGAPASTPEECAPLHPLLDPRGKSSAASTSRPTASRPRRGRRRPARRAVDRGARVLGGHPVLDVPRPSGRVTAVVTEQGTFPADIVVSAPASGARGPARWSISTSRCCRWPTSTPRTAVARSGRRTATSRPFLRHQDRDLYFREHGDRIGIGSYAHRPMPVGPRRPRLSVHAVRRSRSPRRTSRPPGTTPSPCCRPSRGTEVEPRASTASSPSPPDGDAAASASTRTCRASGWPRPCGSPTPPASRRRWPSGSSTASRTSTCTSATSTASRTSSSARLRARRAARRRSSRSTTSCTRSTARGTSAPVARQPVPRPAGGARRGVPGGAGWERPHWYEANAALPEVAQIPARDEWASRFWSPIAGAEALVTRERVAMFDMTPLKRTRGERPGALRVPADGSPRTTLDKPAGAVVYTLLLDAAGGVRSDLTVARLGEQRFQVGANSPLDLDWLRRRRPANGRAHHRHHGRHLLHRPVGTRSHATSWQPLTRADVSHAGLRLLPRAARSTSARCRSPRCACPTSASWAGSSTPRPTWACGCGTRCGTPVRSTGSSPPDAARSTRCGWRRATARGAPT